ncbi:MAG: hypothetical protein WC216_07585 [Gallionella sp.]
MPKAVNSKQIPLCRYAQQPLFTQPTTRYNSMIHMIKRLILLSAFISGAAFTSPDNFSIVVGSALVCHDQVSSNYFDDYMRRFFGKPVFSSGGANWWKVNEKLFDANVQYIIVGLSQDFIGATFKEQPEKLIEKLRDNMGMNFTLTKDGMWVAPSAGVIIRYHDKNTPSKMYCMGSPHSSASY